MEILLLLLLLQVKHCHADFVLQTYMQTVKKGVWLHPVGISHSLEHAYCSIIALLIFGLFVPLNAACILLVSTVEFVVHYIVDFCKVKYGTKDQTKPAFWAQFGADQLAHQLTYIWMVWYLLIS